MAKKKAVARAKHATLKKPKQSRLPGMEDAAIQELEAMAEEYAEVRDERIGLSKREGDMQDDLLALLKKHKKTEYHHLDVHIWLVAVDEKVKVKIGELKPAKKERKIEKSESGSEDDVPADNEPAPVAQVNPESMAVASEA